MQARKIRSERHTKSELQTEYFLYYMEKYKVGKVLGDGTFGSVSKAVDQTTGQVVAIKKMKHKYTEWNDCITLPEIKSLIKFRHPNIVRLFEIVKKNNELFFVFEFMEQNIFQLMKDRNKPFNEIHIRNIIYQCLQGLAYMHKHGYFHRDLKPENLLESQGTVKIADFGLAREIRSKPPFTTYVSTRWYRAPEVILRSQDYNSPIDIFAVGCIMAELYKFWPLFPGQSDRDQIHKIFQILGTPTEQEWSEGYKLAAKADFKFPQFAAQNLQQVIPSASDEALDLIKQMLRYNPTKRPSASNCLAHPYFIVALPILPSLEIKQTQQAEILNTEENQGQDQPSNQANISGYYMRNARYKPGYVCQITAEDI